MHVYHGLKHKLNMQDYFDLDNELEMLTSFMPAALKDGALLVEFKNTDGSDQPTASVLSLHPQDLLGSQPDHDQSEYGIWCYNLNRNCWIWLDYTFIESVQPWPLDLFKEDQLYQTQLQV